MLRTGTALWNSEFADGLIDQEQAKLDTAAKHGLLCWVWLGDLTDLPTTAGSERERVLAKVVNALKGHAALGVWKGVDEPRTPIGAGKQVFRTVSVANGGFRDWFGPHDARVYRFRL